MSRSTPNTFTCPCGNTFTSQIYEYVNTAHDPQLQYTVLAGLLNTPACPICGRRVVLVHPFVYSDPAHALLVYVHSSADVPDEGRSLITEQLHNVYQQIGAQGLYGNSEREATHSNTSSSRRGQHTHHASRATKEQPKPPGTPPLHVVFGLDELNELLNAELSQEERLGRLALSTHSHSEAERGQLLDIARKFAAEMQCQVEVEDVSNQYTVWLYGSRRQIGAIMRELAPRG